MPEAVGAALAAFGTVQRTDEGPAALTQLVREMVSSCIEYPQ
jgi:hypothetical protein